MSRAMQEDPKAVRKIDLLRSRFDQWEMSEVVHEPGVLADVIAPLLSCEISQKQELLETSDVVTRLQKILVLMKSDQQSA